MAQQKVTKYEIIDHGVENEQYFQGCGVAFTDFDHCTTGTGTSAKEAYEDAAESMAQMGFEESDEMKAEAATLPIAEDIPHDEEDLDYGVDCWHYVSIRWS